MWSVLTIWSLNTRDKYCLPIRVILYIIIASRVPWRYYAFEGVIGLIRHVDPESFLQFGTILADRSSLAKKPNHHSVYLSEGSVTAYKTVAPLWLGADAGTSILSVSADGVSFADFYLDKAVQLKGGIWFRLTAFGGKASVQMGGSSMPMSLGSRINHRDFAVRPKVRVECLYTLFYQEKEAGFFFPGEAHPMAELLYVDKGCVHSVADGQELLLRQGELVLYAPDQWHMQYAEGDQAPSMVTISFWARGLQWESLSGRKFRLDRNAALLLQQMLKCQAMDDADSIFSLLTLLLLRLQADENQERTGIQNPVSGENTIIRKAQQYVQTHITEKMTVTVVAENIGVSASYLTALFHKHLQLSPGEYIRRIKLQQSKQLIREGQMNFTEISEALCYSTVHHFSRQFKQMFGMTPTEYAKSVR